MSERPAVPPDFVPFAHTSPFLDSVGQFYVKGWGKDLQLGVFIEERAANRRGSAHGGFLAAVADVALGYAMATSEAPIAALTTASLTIDYAGAARIGDWLEARVDLQHLGRQLGFANVYLFVGEKRVARASGVFARSQS
jgi:acyl-coenzyme A thioesterase 13